MSKSKTKNTSLLSTHKFNETLFIEICNKYISLNFPFYEEKERPSNKLPVNSFNSFDKTLFKILPPAALNKAAEQISADLKIIARDKSYEEITYFTQSNSLGRTLAKRQIEKKVSSSQSFDILSLSEVLTELDRTGYFQKLPSVPKGMLHALYEEELKLGIPESSLIDEIFYHVYREQEKAVLLKPTDKKIKNLRTKINHNFSDSVTNSVFEQYNANWHIILSVDQYIQDQIDVNPKVILAMYSKIRTEFQKLSKNHSHNCPVEDPVHFTSIVESILPAKRRGSLEYENTAFGIVLYFFEMCDFGARYEEEQISFIQKFLDSN